MTIAGGCRCGAVRYELAIDDTPAVYACHCHQCQRWSGGAFSLQALVAESVLAVSGPIVVYEKTTGDHISVQRICGICHSRIYNSNSRAPGIAIVRAGTLDHTQELQCRAHIYIATRQHWLKLPDDVPTFEQSAPPEEFFAIMTAPSQR